MNRIERITAILIHMQSKRVVKAQEIAERFNISLRTVYRDIKMLEEAGVPIIGELGVGYSIMDGYRLPPVMFTREEAIAFQLAEKIVEKYADPSNSDHYKSGMYKIKAVLRRAEKEVVEDVADRIKMVQKKSTQSPVASRVIASLLASITEKRIATIQYSFREENNTDEIVERKIEPIGIFFEEGQWSIIAYCYHIQDYRHYRTERIHAISLSDQVFHKKHMTLNHFFDQMAEEKNRLKVVVNIESAFTRYLQEQKFNYGFVSEELLGDSIQWTFLAPCMEAFSRWFITYADHAQIIEPEQVKVFIRHYLADIAKAI